MDFILFVVIVVFWRVWLYPILSLVRFLPDSFFEPDNTAKYTPIKPRQPYSDSVPDPFTNVKPSTGWVADQYMSPERKAEYLKSPKWYSLKRTVLARDGYKCRVCSSTTDLQVHHITYIGLGGNEELEDLATLCGTCHSKLHKLLGYDRETTFDFSILKSSKTTQY